MTWTHAFAIVATTIGQDIARTWKRRAHGLQRVFTDPDMTSDDLVQVGQDFGSAIADVWVVGGLVRSAARAAQVSRALRVA